jgi:cholera toxin transcriptional activator
VNRVPIADDRNRQRQERNQQQPLSLGGVNRVALVPVIEFVLLLRFVRLRHANIVALTITARVGTGTLVVWERAPRPFAERSSAVLPCSSRAAARGSCPRCYTTASSIPVPQNNSKIARFGVFELDITAGELRKNGRKLRLQEQPFQILALLLDRAGDVVTREELRQKLWAADTFVDFDHGLNTAVNKLREVLGDSASSPRFIETLARRGYRFIAPVKSDVQSDAQIRVQPATPAPQESQYESQREVYAATAMHPDLDVPIPRRGLTRGLFALIQVMYLSFYLSALFRLRIVQNIADSFLPPWSPTALAGVVMVTAGVGIPLRCYLLSAVGFDHRQLAEKFHKMFPFVLALDQLWAVSPFLLTSKIGIGAAFAACAALLYVPFSERTLIRMAYVGNRVRG